MPTSPRISVLGRFQAMLRMSASGDLADGHLLTRFIAQRDEAAFATLVERHGPMVYGVSRRVLGQSQDAEDVFQATFLVLVRKAASLDLRQPLASWLFTVALHTALKARTGAARRKARENEIARTISSDSDAATDGHELRPVLDAELARLPAKYRLPLVLCYLEGLTHQAAAAQLGLPLGTVNGRLARARDLLRQRLVRRGIVVSKVALGILLAEQAALPTSLAGITVRTALEFSAGAAGHAVAAPAVLAEEFLRGMAMAKIKWAAAAVFMLGLAAGLAGLTYSRATTSTAAAGQAPKAPEKSEPPPRTVVLPPIKPAWETSTLPEEALHRAEVDRHLNQDQDRPDAFLPAFIPLLVDGRVIYRSFQGVRVDNLRKGEWEWWAWLDSSLHVQRTDATRWPVVKRWRTEYSTGGQRHLLFENSVLGSSSTDGKFVFVVDDLAIPPHPDHFRPQNLMPNNLGALQESLDHNTLKAYSLETGKLTWELGGKHDRGPLKDSIFVGPPLPLAGKLLVLAEKKGELSLVSLKPQPPSDAGFPQPPVVSRSRKLLDMAQGLNRDMPRRAQVGFVSYSDGVLFCITNTGVAIGVDLLSFQVLWKFSYRPEKQAPPIGKSWKAAPPAMQAGKVVFTAPDGEEIHCLTLRDGKPQWKGARGEGMYLAGVFGDRVLVVGKSTSRILSLTDGKEIAVLATGAPSGQGVASGNRYFLPLRAGAESKAPEICVVDVAKAVVSLRLPLADRQVPGNLAMHSGDVISQTMVRIASYPQLKVPPEKLGRPLTADELVAAWTNLGDAGVRPSINAGWLLASVPEQAVPFLKQRVRPVPIPDAKRLDRLIRELDDKRFAVRSRATEELAAVEDAAEGALQKALAGKPPLEVKRRIDELLERLAQRTPSADQLRTLRAIEVLQMIGTSAALDLVKELAGGAPSAQLTRQARRALNPPGKKGH